MRRPINWLVIVINLAFLAFGLTVSRWGGANQAAESLSAPSNSGFLASHRIDDRGVVYAAREAVYVFESRFDFPGDARTPVHEVRLDEARPDYSGSAEIPGLLWSVGDPLYAIDLPSPIDRRVAGRLQLPAFSRLPGSATEDLRFEIIGRQTPAAVQLPDAGSIPF